MTSDLYTEELERGVPAHTFHHSIIACCCAFVRCVHKAGLVWTDLKLDNMLLCQRDEARAIDLEGAVPARSAPKSYTPDTMPPDFAIASRGGVGAF